MVKFAAIALLLTAAAATSAQAETFVLQSVDPGHEASLKIPVGAVTKLSANYAESLEGYGDSHGETMRLHGDVLISIAGSLQPIEIKADTLVIELTADAAPGVASRRRVDAASHKVLRDASQVFLGNVVFNLQTPAGPMEIKADKVEHRLRVEEGA